MTTARNRATDRIRRDRVLVARSDLLVAGNCAEVFGVRRLYPVWHCRPGIDESVNCLLEHLAIQAAGVLALVQDATVKAWDEWEAAADGSYVTGRELILTVPAAPHAEIERRFNDMRAPLTEAARAAELAYLRLDTYPPANVLLIAWIATV
jgi:hypothetical protein